MELEGAAQAHGPDSFQLPTAAGRAGDRLTAHNIDHAENSGGGSGGGGGMIANFLKDPLGSVQKIFRKRRNPSYMTVA
jgi:hypothetical protein